MIECPYCGDRPDTAIRGRYHPTPVPTHPECIAEALDESREDIISGARARCAYVGVEASIGGDGRYTEDVEFFERSVRVGASDHASLKQACEILEYTVLTGASIGSAGASA